ncbi:hypothetical protein PG993_002305 [Apiospora rasikravindrae]|uniref:Heterokaryon incompatibility domain-containing protein n=1 Tax=Apiospora rasikravindrae TaxID=990691 RepID=A0ABR1TW92_9PEZI
MPEMRDGCKLCSKLGRMFEGFSMDLRHDETVDEPCHQDLLRYIRDIDPGYRQGKLDVIFDCSGVDLFMWYDSRSKAKAIQLIKSPEGSTAEASGRALDNDYVDLGLLREWKAECLQKHGQPCCNPLKIPQVYPAWLIDTQTDCLVPGDGISDFVTLSYVWGAATSLCTEQANLEELQQPGALTKSLISPVIRHAMGLVHALDERYLWADALCVIQDGGEQTTHQLLMMAKIYASAIFTIVVTDGDASTGIPGIAGISPSRELNQVVFPFASHGKLSIKDVGFIDSQLMERPLRYYTRAWTYQEHSLSQRLLVIGKGQFHWVCSSAAFREDSVSESPDLHRIHRFRSPEIMSGYPDLRELGNMICDYNGRDHSFPEDALAGVTGILELFSRTFDGGFLYGLPVMCFPAALMWTSTAPEKALRRLKSGKDHCILQGSHLPSWSWLGWKDGYVYFPETDRTPSNESPPAISGISQWYSHESPSSRYKRPIGPCPPDQVQNHRHSDLESQLAQGWTAETHGPSPDGHNKHLQEMLSPMTPQHAFISCKTRRGWFRVRELYPSTFRFFDANGDGCGFIHVPRAEYDADLPPVGSDQYLTIEVVAICLQNYNLSGTQRSSENRDPTNEESYGVLWVKWVDGVAYRKGVGDVHKRAWESHDLEDIDLILG